MPEIDLNCECPGCPQMFMTVDPGPGYTPVQLRAHYKTRDMVFHCDTCGCVYRMVDDGNPADPTGTVVLSDESPPAVSSLGATVSGTITGGTVVRVSGDGFDVAGATLTVKFDGVAGTSLSVIDRKTLDITTPAGKLRMNISDQCVKLTHGAVSPASFAVGAIVTGITSGAAGTIREVDGGGAFILVNTVSTPFEDGETITDDAGTPNSATLTTTVAMPFQTAETITGVTSGSTGTVDSVAPFKITSPSAAFTAGEEVTGGTSGARATLDGTAPTNGDVDVSVSNDWGQRGDGSSALAGAYEYTI